ncbi:hypothetical protein FSP39_006760 [Pinctada imbricata]|uniref:Disheveled-associated activator of morphogenesis 1 n=1 Tax=Pinctada imbricata TaxID=66713 RepID=A0AA89BRE8_PINIB|nr:hypothetical protein FSP39_006760 [Pinctada imbricata]
MPSKQRFCWCFGGRPPEITYGIESGEPLKAMAVEEPMPEDEKEIDEKFLEIVNELGVDKPHRDALFSLPPEKKWQIYCSKKQDREGNVESSADLYIEKVRNLSNMVVSYSSEDEEPRTKVMDSLKTALRTQPMSFVTRFIDQDGLQHLLAFLQCMDYRTSESPIHTSAIGCVKALMNNSQGRAQILAHPDCINVIAQSLSTENIKTKIAVLEILGAMCLVPGGHKKVLEAMLHYQTFSAERARFQGLVNDLDRSTGIYKEEVNLKTAIMSFFNSALRFGPGQEYLEFRLHLRYEFLMLGVQPVIEKLRKHENATLDRHLDFFEMMRNEDERQFAKKFENVHVDSKSAYSMFDVLRKKLTMTSCYQHFTSILQHLLFLPFGNDTQITGLWGLVDRVVQTVCIQQKNGQDPDGVPVEINVKQMIRQMTSGEDLKSLQQKLRETEKANEELQAKLAKRERECEIRVEEKDELSATVARMKAKLEKESSSQAELRQTIDQLNQQLIALNNQLSTERGERQKLTHLVHTGSLPDDAKVDLSAPAIIGISDGSSPSLRPSVPPPPPPPGAPPPPPPPGMVPPPPPPGAPRLQSKSTLNIPRPKNPMKSLNWSKLSENKISGTIWARLDATKVYREIDLEDFERTFSAYQRQMDEGEDTGSSTKSKARELSVIDGRRAQNCTILLSKLKMTNEEVIRAILDMDSKEDLPKDMLEQLLKFVPTQEEIQLLSEHSQDIEQMARVDKFLYEAGRIGHYEGRLKALYFKKKYPEKMSDIRPKVDAVTKASSVMPKNRQLKKLLEIILALGNFMNRGQRGNASGFRLSSLSNLIDTKSSNNRNLTLLHYLVDLLERKFPEVMRIDAELTNVKQASKVSVVELDKEIASIKKELSSVEKELKYFETCGARDGERFISVMTDFHNVASYNFSEIEEARTEMIQKFEGACQSFGEDPVQSNPEEFFGLVDSFLTSMSEAKAENIRIKKQKEEEEKRAALEEQLKREREKIRSKRSASPMKKENGQDGKSNKGEFDELISALRTGDVFGEDLVKMRRNRKRGSTPTGVNRERFGPVQ